MWKKKAYRAFSTSICNIRTISTVLPSLTSKYFPLKRVKKNTEIISKNFYFKSLYWIQFICHHCNESRHISPVSQKRLILKTRKWRKKENEKVKLQRLHRIGYTHGFVCLNICAHTHTPNTHRPNTVHVKKICSMGGHAAHAIIAYQAHYAHEWNRFKWFGYIFYIWLALILVVLIFFYFFNKSVFSNIRCSCIENNLFGATTTKKGADPSQIDNNNLMVSTIFFFPPSGGIHNYAWFFLFAVAACVCLHCFPFWNQIRQIEIIMLKWDAMNRFIIVFTG